MFSPYLYKDILIHFGNKTEAQARKIVEKLYFEQYGEKLVW